MTSDDTPNSELADADRDTSHVQDQETIQRQLAQVSSQPGVYVMKDANGRILYVGKALNLKKRLQSYFQKGRPHDPKTTVLIGKIKTFETIITRTEKEALILESNLIKRHRPRYNVVLKDDKRYPSLRLDISHAYPNLTVARKIQNDKALYFGPYASAAAVRQTLKFIHKTFKLRKCHNRTFRTRTRPCLNYQMGLCLGPCCFDIDPKVYDDIVKEVIAFLKGRTPDLVKKLKTDMLAAAQNQDFEKAADLRDKMLALEKTLEKQVTVATDFKDRDVFALVADQGLVVVTLLQVRGGFLMGSRHFGFEDVLGTPADQMGLLFRQYYIEQRAIPAEILVNDMDKDLVLVEAYLNEEKGARVKIMAPQRGEKRRIVEMAIGNARKELQDRRQALQNHQYLLEQLAQKLHLKRYPQRIECFDNSHLQGTEPVSGMVVFCDGSPKPEDYRHYKTELIGKPDDYAAMAEVVRRRFGKGEASKPYPDLLLVDGGRGQIGAAVAVLKELGLSGCFDVAGIAKADPAQGEPQDKIYMAGRANDIQFGRRIELLLFLQRIRDEAHRWAIGFQRRRRVKQALHSQLDEIPGVGPKRKVALMKHFGSVDNIRTASEQALQAVKGVSGELAKAIKTFLNDTM